MLQGLLQARFVPVARASDERDSEMAYRLGVDVGGTFTDLFLVSQGNGGARFRVKTPSTPADPSEGVLTGVRRICDEAGIGVDELQNILHGTTVATNAVLESKGARVGLVTTQGASMILHLARSLPDSGAIGGLDHHDQARSSCRRRSPTRARPWSASTPAVKRSSYASRPRRKSRKSCATSSSRGSSP